MINGRAAASRSLSKLNIVFAAVFAALSLAVAGCHVDRPNASAPPTATAPVPDICSTAFSTSAGAASAEASATGPVALSSCSRDASNGVTIGGNFGCGPNVYVDKNFTASNNNGLGKITINKGGALVFPDLGHSSGDPLALTVETTGIAINSGGLFSVGTSTCPIGYHAGAHATIVLTGSRDTTNCNPATGCADGSTKGIEVRSGGALRLYGAKGVPNYANPDEGAPSVSWTHLSLPAGPQAYTTTGSAAVPVANGDAGVVMHLADDVTKGQAPWQKGDWVAVASSSYSPFETEFVQLAADPTTDGTGSKVTLMNTLQFYHFGSVPPTPSQLCTVNNVQARVACGSVPGCNSACESVPSLVNYNDGAASNFGIDERAAVGLISRSITLTARVPAPPPADQTPLNPDPSLHWGGEIKILAGAKEVGIQGVELEKFGKDQLGSYPIHFHMAGDATKISPLVVSANSIHHSFNKCVTVHMTSNLTVADSVCARAVGQLFYEETGAETGITFQNNLGMGAMSNTFDIYPVTTVGPNPQSIPRSKLISQYWWIGDNLAATSGYNYDGFNVLNYDDQTDVAGGSCGSADGNGGYAGYQTPNSPPHPGPCTNANNDWYVEPANGFWITNPGTNLIGNEIVGCQGVGRGFEWATPGSPIPINGNLVTLGVVPVGTFFDNRADACYSGFYGENEYSIRSSVMTPHKGGANGGQPIIARFDGMIANHNRFRGVWLRPTWFIVEDGRFSGDRENVSLVTSGGIDGNAPGVWALLEDSVLAGISQNNVSRWGPCPTENQLGINTGAQFGCIDHTPVPGGAAAAHSADEVGLGYPPPWWNEFGYMLYDGPVRVFHDHFVNFKADISTLLTTADNTFLTNYSSSHQTPTGKFPFVYEGDAAFGWFQSNQSSYPTGTVSKELSWTNTDLRHQIYTEVVGVNTEFNDGDKNTAIVDEDGSLTGFGIGDATSLKPVCVPGQTAGPGCIQAISLNNLPFNATANSVDECFSRGGQNAKYEGRDSSLISSGSMGTLEFSTLYPWQQTTGNPPTPVPFPGPNGDTSHTQFLTFSRDDLSAGQNNTTFHPTMQLHSRDGRGVWEPKLTSGFGYTVSASPAPNFPGSTGKAGIANIIDVGIADVVKPDISATNPYFVRLGICYSNADGSHPQDATKFAIQRGYKMYTGGNVNPTDPELQKYWTNLSCTNLDSLNTANIVSQNSNPPTCPAPRQRTIPLPNSGTCPTGYTQSGQTCVSPTDNLDLVGSPDQMSNPDGTPNLEKFFYDKNTGMLFMWVAQDEANPVAPSPLGTCGANGPGDPSCPSVSNAETYYACPKNGCHIYIITLNDTTYQPGASTCQPYETYSHAPFVTPNQVVLSGTTTAVKQVLQFDLQGQPYHSADPSTDPGCKTSQSPTKAGLRASAGGHKMPPAQPKALAGRNVKRSHRHAAEERATEREKTAGTTAPAPKHDVSASGGIAPASYAPDAGM